MKITFKTNKPTGRYRSFWHTTHDVKYKGEVIGSIEDEHPHTVRLQALKKDLNEDGNPNCNWKWVKYKFEFANIDEAKSFVLSRQDEILKLTGHFKPLQSIKKL